MEQNLELHKHINFEELVQHGIDNGANIVNGMPWSWKINGKTITHENDHCYIVETALDGYQMMRPDNTLAAYENGLHLFKINFYDTHAPNGCPM